MTGGDAVARRFEAATSMLVGLSSSRFARGDAAHLDLGGQTSIEAAAGDRSATGVVVRSCDASACSAFWF
jgi:hypothetical protein